MIKETSRPDKVGQEDLRQQMILIIFVFKRKTYE